MRRILLALAAGTALLSGCYHITVVTGAPAAPTTIDKPWQNSFVIGLVPPPEVNTATQCPQGVARVETERSFLNGLVGAITQSIYTPMHARVTCAAGPVKQ
jgi:hypothetical protein